MVKVELTRNPVASIVDELRKAHDAFEKSMRSSLELAVELGRKLNEAKAKLPHGEFGKLFRDHATPIEGAMPCSIRWAHKLMSIAQHEVIANRKHASDLPHDVEAVYQLARVDSDKLKSAMEQGEVRPDMTRAETKQLVAKLEPAKTQTQRKDPSESERLSEFFNKFKTFYDFAAAFITQYPQHKGKIELCIGNLQQLRANHDD
jgi:hypothetical protein